MTRRKKGEGFNQREQQGVRGTNFQDVIQRGGKQGVQPGEQTTIDLGEPQRKGKKKGCEA